MTRRLASPPTSARLLAASLLAISTVMLSGGCNVLGFAAAVAGPPPVPPQYVPQPRSTLVLVENFRNPSLVEVDADRLARQLGDELTERQIVPVVPIDRVWALRDRTGSVALRSMSIPAVGRAVDAEQVLYVDLQHVSLQGAVGTNMYRGRIVAQVRIVDAATGETLWPTDLSEGYAVTLEVPFREAPDRDAQLARNRLLDLAATRIARLFYEWKPGESEDTE